MRCATLDSGDRPASRTVITGGASGLGAAVAQRCAHAGHDVVVIDRNSSPFRTIRADLGDVDHAAAAVHDAVDMLGGLDNVVLSAGINRPGVTAEADIHSVAAIVQVNLIGTIVACIAAIPHLERTRGKLIVIGSTLSRRGNVGQAAYAASKFGLAGFVQSLGLELRGRISISLVNPGAMDTALFDERAREWKPDAGTMMSSETVASAVMFALQQPKDVSVRELLITHTSASDWP